MHKVAILTCNKVAMFELACAVELFGLPRPEFDRWYDCEVVTFGDDELLTTAGVHLRVQQAVSLDGYETLIVPSWPLCQSELSEPLAQHVVHFANSGKRVVSFCSGAFLLAQLGLLNGRKATTHWRYAEQFKLRFPAVNYVDDVLYVYDGHIGCSAGSAAGLDLGIEIIRSDFGYKVANQVARRLVLSAHRSGGQAQFVELPVLSKPGRPGKLAAVLDWANQNLRDIRDVNTLAERAAMSRRTFDRKFRATLNLSPLEWLTIQKVNAAKSLLESSELSIELLANEVGFENAITLRHHFRNSLGVSPGQYRKQFRRAQHK